MESNDGKWMFNQYYDGNWSNGNSDYYDTKKEAIHQGFNEFPREHYDKFYIGQVKLVNDDIKVSAENILEQISLDLYDVAGEVSDGYLNFVKEEDLKILDQSLNDVVLNWMNEYGYLPRFFKIENAEKIEVL